VLVTKPAILAFGLNAQCCARQLFIGADHSFEQWYQAVRRSWRFGQTRPVHVHMVRTSADGRIIDNLRRKQQEFQQMHRELADAVNGRRAA
jgi:SNF2 family DNA or RNA helicase